MSEALSAQDNASHKALLDRIVAILTKLGQCGYAVYEESVEYESGEIDTEPDPDGNSMRTGLQPGVPVRWLDSFSFEFSSRTSDSPTSLLETFA